MTTQKSAQGGSAARYQWVDFAKGLCIVAVVCLYANNELMQTQGSSGWLGAWTEFARPFRMPDFFLLSGLFLAVVIDRPWRSYLDTKVVHYLYFLVLWVTLVFLYEDVLFGEGPTSKPLGTYVWALYKPDHMLWFIQTLPMFFVSARLLRWLPAPAHLLLAVILFFLDPRTPHRWIEHFAHYYVFFVTGWIGAKVIFGYADAVARHARLAWVGFVAWVFVNTYAVWSGWTASTAGAFAFGFIGIAAIVALSRLVTDVRAFDWLRYIGQRSIVVYLGFLVPMLAIAHLYRLSGVQLDPNLVAVLLVAICVAFPLGLELIVRRSPFKFLFARPDWAHIDRTSRKSARTPLVPAGQIDRH